MQPLWARVVMRKWLNMGGNEPDYRADPDDDNEDDPQSESDDEGESIQLSFYCFEYLCEFVFLCVGLNFLRIWKWSIMIMSKLSETLELRLYNSFSVCLFL